MKVTTTRMGDVLVAHLSGEIDTMDSEGLGEALAAMSEAGTAGVVLDFAGVTYIASMGISMVLKLAQELRKAKSPVVIAGATPAVKTVLEMVHLGSVIPMEATVEAAAGRLGAVTV